MIHPLKFSKFSNNFLLAEKENLDLFFVNSSEISFILNMLALATTI
jgi:hypothetical protein